MRQSFCILVYRIDFSCAWLLLQQFFFFFFFKQCAANGYVLFFSLSSCGQFLIISSDSRDFKILDLIRYFLSEMFFYIYIVTAIACSFFRNTRK